MEDLQISDRPSRVTMVSTTGVDGEPPGFQVDGVGDGGGCGTCDGSPGS